MDELGSCIKDSCSDFQAGVEDPTGAIKETYCMDDPTPDDFFKDEETKKNDIKNDITTTTTTLVYDAFCLDGKAKYVGVALAEAGLGKCTNYQDSWCPAQTTSPTDKLGSTIDDKANTACSDASCGDNDANDAMCCDGFKTVGRLIPVEMHGFAMNRALGDLNKNYGQDVLGSQREGEPPPTKKARDRNLGRRTLEECAAVIGTKEGKDGCVIKYAARSKNRNCHTFCDYYAHSTVEHVDTPITGAWFLESNILLGLIPTVDSECFVNKNKGIYSGALTDGITTDFGKVNENYWHSCGADAWAKIQLPMLYEVTEVRVTNRCDCCAEQLDGSKVYVKSGDSEVQCGDTITGIGNCATVIVTCKIVGSEIILRGAGLPLNVVEIAASGVPSQAKTNCPVSLSEDQCEKYNDGEGASGGYRRRRGSALDNIQKVTEPLAPNGCVMHGMHDDPSGGVSWNTGGTDQWFPETFEEGRSGFQRLCCGSTALFPTTTTTTGAAGGPTTTEFIIPHVTGNDPPLQHNLACRTPDCKIDFIPDETKRLCSFYGDPHWRTFDNKKYDFYGHGSYWLVKSPDVWMQAHYEPRWLSSPGRTWTSKIAFAGPFLRGSTMMIEATTAWWNDKKGILRFDTDSTWTSDDGGTTATFDFNTKKVTVILHPDIKIEVTLAALSHRGKTAVPVFSAVHIGMRHIKGQEGMCGDLLGSVKSYSTAVKYKVTDPNEALIPH